MWKNPPGGLSGPRSHASAGQNSAGSTAGSVESQPTVASIPHHAVGWVISKPRAPPTTLRSRSAWLRIRLGVAKPSSNGSRSSPSDSGARGLTLWPRLDTNDLINDTVTIDVGSLDPKRTFLAPIGSTGFNPRFNSDGLLRDAPGSDWNSDGFLQLFRNGVIESVDSTMMIGRGQKDGLPSIKFVNDLVKFVAGACDIFRELDVQPPVLVLVSFVGIRGAPLLVSAEDIGGSAYYACPFDKDPLLRREVHLVDLNADVRPALRVALDALWQAAGEQRCSFYATDGTWINK